MSLLGDRLKQLRKLKNVMQKDIAAHLETTTLAYQRYEYGDREPNLTKLIALADYFDVSLDYLVGRSDDPARH